MVNIAVLAKKTAPLVFDFDGEKVNAEFYPHRITPSYRALLSRLDSGSILDEESKSAAAKMVSELVTKWDVMAGDDPAPLSYEALLEIPLTLLGATVQAIWEAVGKQMSGESSS